MSKLGLSLVVCLALLQATFGAACSGASQSAPARERPTAEPTLQAAPTQPAAPTRGAPQPQTRAPVPPTATPGTDSQPATQEAAPDPRAAQAAGAYRAIEHAVARIRGLPRNRDIELRFMSQAELRQFFLNAFDRDYTPAERESDQKLLLTLGLIRPDQELTTIMLNVLSDQVIGFYDDDVRRMHLIGEVIEPTPSSKVTFAHEFTHALQDEQFNLRALNPPDSDNDDRSAAIHALIEGDATLVMTLYARNELNVEERRQYVQSQSGGDSGALEEAPLVLRDELLFPYTAGTRFVQTLHRQGGFAAVDAAFRDPPRSTEQILHPEKYVAGEAPSTVTMPDLQAALGEGWTQTTTNTLGELDVRILVEQFTDRATAERAAAGWAGDRYALLEDAAGRPAVAIKTTWDSSQDAWEFFRAYGGAARNRYGPQSQVIARDPSREVLAGPGYAALVELQGHDVLVVLAPDEVAMNRLAEALGGTRPGG